MSRRSLNSTKVFVGSLPADATADDLRKLFRPYGVISECDIANRCGFLHLEDNVLARKAIDELNDAQFMGGRISVEMGRTKARRGNGPPSRGGGAKMRDGRMGRDSGPYSRPYGSRGGSGGLGRAGGYEPDYYNDRNSIHTPARNDERTYSTYSDNRGSMGMFQNSSSTYDRGYSGDNGRNMSSYQQSSNNGYAMGSGGERAMTGYNDNLRMGAAEMYDERRAPVMSGSGIIGERRPLNQSMSQSNRDDNYSQNYNTRDSGPTKQLMSSGGYSDRSYGSNQMIARGYSLYSSPPSNPNSGYATQMSSGGYGDTRQMSSSDYDSSAGAYSSMSSGGGYSSTVQASGNSASYRSGSYGDTYGQRTYDNAYPALPQQRSGYAGTYEPPSNYHY